MRAVVAGPDGEGIADALESADVDVARVGSPVFSEALADAGVEDADLFVLTDAEEAISLSLAKEANPDLKAVFYGDGSLPESVSAVVDLVVDPRLLDADAVAEELAREP